MYEGKVQQWFCELNEAIQNIFDEDGSGMSSI